FTWTGGYLRKHCDSLTFEEAAALPMAAVTALQAVRDNANVKQGQSVLINGASGGVGMFAVQIAKALGAVVTAVCNTGSVDTVSSLGADAIVDYKKEDVINIRRHFDVVIDVVATLSVKDYRHLLKQNGICIVIGFSTMRHMISYNLAGKKDGKKIKLCMANNKISEPLLDVNKLVEAGKLRVVIDSRYSLDETAEALRHMETGHPKGKVIIEIA
ncbi:MAG: NAD(P)-dependent alcohol dehydrogenase, partial [Dehalococcoidia bacterium]|nr:NAD(P)-dependent alcohol dehydrogenase [Dehalococcoidia bacterium]